MNPRSDETEFDGELFDFQVNGFAGVDFQQPSLPHADLLRAVRALRQHGAGRFFLTLITDDIDALRRKLEGIERHCARDKECRDAVVGYHLEGPWLNAEDGFRGAHRAAPMRAPKVADFAALQSAAQGRIKLVTLAPERPGSDEMISHLSGAGIHVALGHTNASETEIDMAIACGARFCTHLGNGTPQVLPRHDNVIQRLLARDELIACLIPDGTHLPPYVLKNFVRAKPAGRVLFTTDVMAAGAASAGSYSICGTRVEVGVDGVARLPGGGFAGSTLTPAEGVRRTACYLGISLNESRRIWSEAACQAFGVDAESAAKRRT
ncbi:MAG: N-acetylglucosamine-6-phosphate deacetylase [Verrucomicrobiota bacterium]